MKVLWVLAESSPRHAPTPYTRDKMIRKRPVEKAALVQYPLRLLVLTTVGRLNVWEQLRVLIARWDRIEELSQQPPPWMFAVTKGGLRELKITGTKAKETTKCPSPNLSANGE